MMFGSEQAQRALGIEDYYMQQETERRAASAPAAGDWVAFAREHAVDAGNRPIPLRDYVLCEVERQDVTAGGIVLPDNSKERRYAKVVAHGPGHYDSGVFIPVQVRPGDRLLFDPNMMGAELHVFRWRDKEYAMVREFQISGLLPGDLPAPSLISKPELVLP